MTAPMPPSGYQPPLAMQPKKKHRKWPWVILGLIVIIVIIAVASNGGGDDNKAAPAPASIGQAAQQPAAETSAKASHPAGLKDASADVALGAITVDDVLGMPSAPVTITNHSSKRSNYLVEIALETADGKTQIDSAMVAVNNLDAGQASVQKAQFTTTDALPAGAKLVIKEVTRYAA